MIEVESLSKRYGNKLAVDGLNFVVQPGIVTGFLGPNGSGKSTTMRMIAGLDQPTAGRVTVNGGDYRTSAAPMAELGVLLEAKAVHTGRSARNHLLALAQTNGIKTRRVDAVIDIVGLRDVAGRRVGGFSLGMGQRLGVASALLGNPQTVVLDEPVNGLDPEGVRWMRTMLKDLAAEGHTVFVSSHLIERDGPNSNPPGRHRPWPADRRHHSRRIRGPRLESFRDRASTPNAAPATTSDNSKRSATPSLSPPRTNQTPIEPDPANNTPGHLALPSFSWIFRSEETGSWARSDAWPRQR